MNSYTFLLGTCATERLKTLSVCRPPGPRGRAADRKAGTALKAHLPRAALAVAMLPALAPASAAQQKQPAASPEQVARAVVRADSTGDWIALLRLAHPDALVRFRGLQTFQLRMLGNAELPAADSLGMDSLGVDSTVQARWQRARTRQVRFMLDSVFLVPSVDSLAHTSPDTVFARWFRGSRASSARDSAPTPKAPPPYRVIGAVRANDTLAYVVVVRPVVQPLGPMPEMFRDFPRETQQTEVMIMRRLGRVWKSMLDGVGEPYGYSADLGTEE